MKELNFEEIRALASESVEEMKVVTPFIFREWQELQEAVHDLRRATQRVKEAQAAWDRLGTSNVSKKE